MNEKSRSPFRRAASYVIATVLASVLVKIALLMIDRYSPGQITTLPTVHEKAAPLEQGHFRDSVYCDGQWEWRDSVGRTKPLDIKLPDGSHVRLGFCSSLRYPFNFTGDNRRLILNGQAEFDIEHNSDHPLIIQTGRSSIQVLGTILDVTDFDGDSSCEVTLLTGKVDVSHDGETLTLKTLQQTVILNGRMRIRDLSHWDKWTGCADDDEPCLHFDSTDLYSALQRMARWYKVKIVPQMDLSGLTVSGDMQLLRSPEENLHFLEKIESGNIRVQLKKDTVYINR